MCWVYTSIYGQDGSETLTIKNWTTSGRMMCEGPRFVEAPMSGALCLSWSQWHDKLPERAKLVVAGRKSPLGINIKRIVEVQLTEDQQYWQMKREQNASSSS